MDRCDGSSNSLIEEQTCSTGQSRSDLLLAHVDRRCPRAQAPTGARAGEAACAYIRRRTRQIGGEREDSPDRSDAACRRACGAPRPRPGVAAAAAAGRWVTVGEGWMRWGATGGGGCGVGKREVEAGERRDGYVLRRGVEEEDVRARANWSRPPPDRARGNGDGPSRFPPRSPRIQRV